MNEDTKNNMINFENGSVNLSELTAILDTLPFDISFVDKNDIARYFNKRKHIFKKHKNSLNKDVIKCHPPRTIENVKRILSDFRNGIAKKAAFWHYKDDRFVYAEYTALYDQNGEYLGVLEVVQDLTDKKALEGEQFELKYI